MIIGMIKAGMFALSPFSIAVYYVAKGFEL